MKLVETAPRRSDDARRGYGDRLWQLAAAGDAGTLADAATRLAAPDAANYDASRARAFALALHGRADGALATLNDGWSDEWPTPAMYATDVARVHLLGGDARRALDALDLAVRSAERADPVTAEIAERCVARDRRLWRRAVAVVARARGSGRARAALRLTRAATKGS
jgi:hypothetical protein